MLDTLYEGLCSYFDILSKTGYLDYDSVSKLLVYLILYEMIQDGDFSDCTDSDGLMLLERFMEMLKDSTCILPDNISCSC